MTQRDDAVKILLDSDILVQSTDYGFKILHEEVLHGNFAECGMDNDSSISLSVNIAEDPPVAWFFRISYIEMSQFIVQAYKTAAGPNPSRRAIIKSMREQDELYDDTKLTEMTESFLLNLEDNEG